MKARFQDIATTVKQSSLLRLATVVTCGAALGALLSFIVNSALVEISLNPIFAFYMAFLFFFVGGVILFRVQSHQTAQRRYLLAGFALLVILSGILCLFFDPKWIFTLSTAARVPIYALIGLSLCFAITFATVDLINFSTASCYPDSPALIESIDQIHLVLATSIIMGVGYGFVFGLMDVGKSATTSKQLGNQLGVEVMFCIPFGLVLGGGGAALNEYFRNRQIKANEYKYSPLFQDDTMI